MPLNLPEEFKKDIQSKDTALVPVISITPQTILSSEDYIYLSTNSITIDAIGGLNMQCKPLLLNIPSLKESIDIEKRNYKISSVNIDISNFPYEGKRFSELVGDSSLINYECRIFWVSPSVDVIAWQDVTPDSTNNNWAFQVYIGTVRRYTHDDEKVRLVVEDRSQSTLHKPVLDILDSETDGVPDKYKNKPVPMVYGFVDRSPCIISKAPLVEDWGIPTGNIIIRADKDGAIEIITNLLIYDNGYVDVPSTLALEYGTKILEYLDGTEQWESTSNQTIQLANTSATTDGTENVNPISNNKIIVTQEIDKNSMTYKPLQQKSNYWSAVVGATGIVGNRAWYGSYYRNVDGVPSFYGSIFTELFTSFPNSWGGEYSLSGVDVPQLNPTEEQFYVDAYGIYDETIANIYRDIKLVGGIIQTGAFSLSSAEASEGILNWRGELWATNPASYGGEADKRLDIRVGGDLTGDYVPYDHDISFSDHSDYLDPGWSQDNEFTISQTTGSSYKIPSDSGAWAKIDNTNQLLAYCKIPDERPMTMALELKFDTLKLYSYSLMKDMLNQDFYARVVGRQMQGGTIHDSPTAPIVIQDILETQLGQTDINITGTYGWKYSFTVDKQINSKKLLENIASVSPYIPRFNNMGKFILTEIPMGGNPPSGVEVQTIKEDDVINFSFSRTKIEDVYTKVVFKYNWDYAKEEFNSSVEADVQQFIISPAYDFNYYGLEDPQWDAPNWKFIHPDSTLVIDDDRGKYIRDYWSAKDFADWYLMWSCNQHLKLKIKLPLKYLYLEIGDFVDFDEILGGVKPYGINYKNIDYVNYQAVFKNFLITSTNKNLEWVEIECIQMHNLGDCYNSVYDCAAICNGTSVEDDCGVCNGNNETCVDCNGVMNGGWSVMCEIGCASLEDNMANCEQDCAGVPIFQGGGAVNDICGVCGGDGIPEGYCDCDGNILDCAGDCGGDSVLDVCGDCGATGGSCYPVADAGVNQDLTTGLVETIYLDGSASDVPNPNNYADVPFLKWYQWTIVSYDGINFPPGYSFEDEFDDGTIGIGIDMGFSGSVPIVSFNIPLSEGYSTEIEGEVGTFVMMLNVWDSVGRLSTDTVHINIFPEPIIEDCTPQLQGFSTDIITYSQYTINTFWQNPNDIGTCNAYIEHSDVDISIPLTSQPFFKIQKMVVNFSAINYYSGEPLVSEVKIIVESDDDQFVNILIHELTTTITTSADTAVATFDPPQTAIVAELIEEGGIIQERDYNLRLRLLITAPNGISGEVMDYQESLPITIAYQECSATGDVNGDGIWDAEDIALLHDLLLSEQCDPEVNQNGLPIECCAADTTADGAVNVNDFVALVNCIAQGTCGG